MDLEAKLDNLKRMIAEKGNLLVAYSGGVDSSLLAKVAADALGDDSLAIIMDHEAFPRSELKSAQEIAYNLGFNLLVIRFPILEQEDISANTPEKCYICKKEFSRRLKKVAKEKGIAWVADGANLSDYSDYRPGIKACDEEGIWHPFVQAEITKEDIRAIARTLDLPFWNKPSSACLASRLPYGERITGEKLKRIEEAEDFLKNLGLSQLRVRCHKDLARVEVLEEDMLRVLALREVVTKKLKGLGFQYVTLDLQGFRCGSMNEALWTSQG